MDEYTDDYEEKCNAILDWAEDHPDFETDFVQNMLDIIEDGGELTERQEQAIDNIIERWRIEI